MASWIFQVSMSEHFISRTPFFHLNAVSVTTWNVYYALIRRHRSPAWTFSTNTLKVESVRVVLYPSRVSVPPSAALWASCVEGGMEDVTDGGKGWSWLRVCPRMVASEQCLVVCRMYFEGCKMSLSFFLSAFLSLSFFHFSPFFNLISPFHFLSRQIVSG